jgi:hypothetical protein
MSSDQLSEVGVFKNHKIGHTTRGRASSKMQESGIQAYQSDHIVDPDVLFSGQLLNYLCDRTVLYFLRFSPGVLKFCFRGGASWSLNLHSPN